MEAIEVEATDKGIFITTDDLGDGDHCILVSPDQVDALCQWLQEAIETLKNKLKG